MQNKLSFGANRNSRKSKSIMVGKGVFVSKATIAAVRAEYNTRMLETSTGTLDDIALRMKLDQEGLDFQKDIYIAGRFKREPVNDPEGQVVDWGSAFRVARVFDVLNIKGDLDEETLQIPAEQVQELFGKEVFYLQYIRGLRTNGSGKNSYADYRLIDARQGEEEDQAVADRLFERFENDFNGGYISNYHPEILADKKEFSNPKTDTATKPEEKAADLW